MSCARTAAVSTKQVSVFGSLLPGSLQHERKVQELAYPDKSVSRFVADMSEKQISAREFFNAALLDELQRDFGLKKAIILIFDTDGNFLSWITKKGIQEAAPDHAYSEIMPYDKMRQEMYREAVRDELTYFNHEPRIYRASDYYEAGQYDSSRFAQWMENKFGGHYVLSFALGINAYIQISFFRSFEEGDYSDEEIENFRQIYQYIAMTYSGFKKHEQTKIVSKIKDEIISSGARAYLITDDFTHVMGYSQEAARLLTGICGEAVSAQLENGEPCLWLPFLLGIETGNTEDDGTAVKKIKNLVFRIYTYDRSYSHGIVDRYHWIAISQETSVKQKSYDELSLTAAERKVATFLCRGLTYQKIADELCISYHTVKNHVQNIFSKCGVNSRYELYEILNGAAGEDESAK